MKPITYTYLVIIYVFSSSCLANIVMTGSRVVYNEGHQFVEIDLNNKSDNTFLVQAWIDDTSNSSKNVDYVIVPPLAKLNPHSGQAVRLVATNSNNSFKDRESVSYFNFLQIPSNKTNTEGVSQNKLVVTVKHRVKVFFRPKTILNYKDNFTTNVKAKLIHHEGNNLSVRVYNNRPYHLSMSGFVKLIYKTNEFTSPGKMISPYSYEDFNFTLPMGFSKYHENGVIEFHSINDQGGIERRHYKLK